MCDFVVRTFDSQVKSCPQKLMLQQKLGDREGVQEKIIYLFCKGEVEEYLFLGNGKGCSFYLCWKDNRRGCPL